MDDIFSAIDDSYATFIPDAYPPAPPSSAATGADPDPVTFEYRRQPGHWTVADTALCSGIDDGVPTVIQLPYHYEVAAEAAQAHALSESALTKLERATQEQEKGKVAAAAVEKDAQEQEKAAAAAVQEVKVTSVAKEKEALKGLHLSKSAGAGVKIVSKDGKKEFVIRPYSINQLATRTANSAPAKDKDDQPAPTATQDAAPKAPSKAPTDAQRPLNPASGMRQVKIVGKNGEEAFVALPFSTIGQTTASKSRILKNEKSASMDKAAESKISAEKVARRDEKLEQDKKAAVMAEQLRAEREKQENNEKEQEKLGKEEQKRQEKEKKEQQKRQEHAVAAAAMSGALPGSHKPSRATKPISIHSSKGASSRSPSVLNGIFDDASKPPSKASSRTMTPPPAQAASVKAASHVSSQQAKKVSVAGWQSVGSGKVRSQKDAYEGAWQDGAVDVAPTAWASKQGSERAASLIYVGSKRVSSPRSGHRTNASPRLDCQDAAASQAGVNSLPRRSGEKAAFHNSGYRQQASPQPIWQDLGSAIIQPAQSTSQPPTQANDPWHGADAVYKTPSIAHQASRNPPQRRKASTPPSRPVTITSSEIAGKIAGINKWNNATPGAHPPPASLHKQRQRPSPIPHPIDPRRANNASQDTIFAGTGWISPHPLSEPPSELAVEPQEAIDVGDGRMMTFEEWRVLQQEHRSFVGMRGGAAEIAGRRTWSRTSSDGRSRPSGQWAETQRRPPGSLLRAMGQEVQLASAERPPPASLFRGHRSFGGGHAASNYRVPTVVSERDEPSSSQYSSSSRKAPQPSEFRAHGVPSSTHSWGKTEQFAAPNAQQSFDDPLPPVGYWGTVPWSDDGGSERVGLGLEALIEEDEKWWRELERRESPVAVGSTNERYATGGSASPREGGSVRLPMPWD